MKKYYKYINSLVLLLVLSYSAHAVSYAEINGTMTIYPGGATTMSRQLYIGPHAVINVVGEWRIASQEIYISPTATITGTGTIILDNPTIYTIGTTPLPAGTLAIDGGNATIGCNVIMRNPQGATLMTISPAAVLGYPSDTVADMVFDGRLTFDAATSGNNFTLNQYHTEFTARGFVAGYAPQHFMITNSTGSVRKDGLNAAGFVFPVGVAAADYTPARLVNTGTADQYGVRALSAIAPVNPEETDASIYRTWDIREAVAGGSDVTLTLQHNQTTGAGGPATPDPMYQDDQAYIGRSNDQASVWDVYPVSAGILPGTITDAAPLANASMLTRSGLDDFTTTTRFSKFSYVNLLSIKAVKTAIPDSVYLGDNFTYHIKVINNGFQTLTPPLSVVDDVPLGAQIISTSSSSGMTITQSGQLVTAVSNDSLHRGDSLILDIYVRAMSDTLKNLAYIHGFGAVPVPSGACDSCAPGTPTFPVVLYRQVWIPNSFTPNGDGTNDNFVIPNLLQSYPNATLSIYNRNGDEVWFSNGPYRDNFKGLNYNGAVLPDGTYFYVLYYNDGTARKDAHFLDLTR